MTENSARGEVSLTLGDRMIVLKPEFARKVKIESRIEKGLGELLGSMRNRGLRHVEAAAFLEEAAGLKPSEAAKLIDDYGLAGEIGRAVVDFCQNAILGGISADELRRAQEVAEKNAVAAEPTTATAASHTEDI